MYGQLDACVKEKAPAVEIATGVIVPNNRIVLFTSTVSHQMVHVAVKEAKRKIIPVFRCHTSSGTSLEGLLQEIEATTGSVSIAK